MKKRICAMLAAVFLLLAPGFSALALDDDEYGGYAADTLTVKVGYFGGPYYEKKVFTLDDLWAMNVVYADYTFIDNMPSVVIDHVAGVRLGDIMDVSGIDLGSIQTFYFWTRDKQSDFFTSFPKTALIDTPRYCYYSLPDNFDEEEGRGNEYADSDGAAVSTLIALADDWNRCIAGATFGSDYANLNTNTRFRLVFGQTNSYEHTASRSAKWIHEIVVELGGAPTLTLDASVLELEVGSLRRVEALVGAADAVIAENEAVTWSSSDESVATVDENGNITVHAEGSAVITASLAGGATASVTVIGSPEPAESERSSDGPGGTGGGGIGVGSGSDTSSTGDQSTGGTYEIELGGEHESVPPVDGGPGPDGAQSGAAGGGVQNWRVFEMSKTAVELPVIIEDNPLMPVMAALAAGLLLSGMAYKWIKFKFDIGDKEDVFIRKPQ